MTEAGTANGSGGQRPPGIRPQAPARPWTGETTWLGTHRSPRRLLTRETQKIGEEGRNGLTRVTPPHSKGPPDPGGSVSLEQNHLSVQLLRRQILHITWPFPHTSLQGTVSPRRARARPPCGRTNTRLPSPRRGAQCSERPRSSGLTWLAWGARVPWKTRLSFVANGARKAKPWRPWRARVTATAGESNSPGGATLSFQSYGPLTGKEKKNVISRRTRTGHLPSSAVCRQ